MVCNKDQKAYADKIKHFAIPNKTYLNRMIYSLSIIAFHRCFHIAIKNMEAGNIATGNIADINKLADLVPALIFRLI